MQRPLELFGGLRVACLGVQHCAIDVQDRNNNGRHNVQDAKLFAVDQIHHNTENAEHRCDHTPFDEILGFFAAFAVLDALDAGNQLTNAAGQVK